MRIAPDGNRGGPPPQVKHETLFNNEDLNAAGEIQFDHGSIVDLNDRSGSYGTDNELSGEGQAGRQFRDAVRKALAVAGVAVGGRALERIHD